MLSWKRLSPHLAIKNWIHEPCSLLPLAQPCPPRSHTVSSALQALLHLQPSCIQGSSQEYPGPQEAIAVTALSLVFPPHSQQILSTVQHQASEITLCQSVWGIPSTLAITVQLHVTRLLTASLIGVLMAKCTCASEEQAVLPEQKRV